MEKYNVPRGIIDIIDDLFDYTSIMNGYCSCCEYVAIKSYEAKCNIDVVDRMIHEYVEDPTIIEEEHGNGFLSYSSYTIEYDKVRKAIFLAAYDEE